MIFITVGTQLPFDRLIQAVDGLADSIDQPMFAQTGVGTYVPQNMEWSALLNPVRFDDLIRQTTIIVSHAGIGTVLMAQKYKKPAILYPRRAALGEHRNDHQAATANALRGRPGIYIADSDDALADLLQSRLDPPQPDRPVPSREMLRERIAEYIIDA